MLGYPNELQLYIDPVDLLKSVAPWALELILGPPLGRLELLTYPPIDSTKTTYLKKVIRTVRKIYPSLSIILKLKAVYNFIIITSKSI